MIIFKYNLKYNINAIFSKSINRCSLGTNIILDKKLYFIYAIGIV